MARSLIIWMLQSRLSEIVSDFIPIDLVERPPKSRMCGYPHKNFPCYRLITAPLTQINEILLTQATKMLAPAKISKC